MPQLFIKKHFETLGEARDFMLSVAQQMNQGHTSGAGWGLHEKGEKPDKKEDVKKEPDAPATGEGTASTTPPVPATDGETKKEPAGNDAAMPWAKNKK